MQELTGKLDALIGRGRWEEAEDLLFSERERAAARLDDSLVLSVENERMGYYRMCGREDGFLDALGNTGRLLKTVRIDRRSRGTILVNAATGLVAFGRASEAIPLYREAEALYKAVLSPDDPLFAALYNNMASAYWAQRDYASAEKQMQRALSILEKRPVHPDLATTWVNLARLYAASGAEERRVGEALDRARAVFDDTEIVWDGYYAHTAQKCAGAFAELGRPEDADELLERVELIHEGT